MDMRALRPFALLMLLALPAFAGVGVWTPLGPDGGSVSSLIADPSAPETLYTGSTLGILKTTDGGQTWTLLRREPDGAVVIAILDDTVYARLGFRGLFKSTDEGRTWTAAANIPRDVFRLIADPRVPNRVWAAGRTVYLSNDDGATWQALPKPKVKRPPAHPTALAIDPSGPWIYLATTRGFFRSADLGKTWQPGDGIRGGRTPYHLAVDARNPAVLYLATHQDVFRSVDRGAHWHRALSVPIQDFITHLITHEDRVYVSVHGAGISYSSNLGVTWTRAAQGPADPTVLAASLGTVYAGTNGNGRPGGLFRSLDRGTTWQRAANEGLQEVGVAAVAVDPTDPNILYAGSDRSGLSRSTDRGATWKAVGLGFPPGDPVNILQVLVEPSRPSTVYALRGDMPWLVRSDDGGTTWKRFRLPFTVVSIALDPRQPGALWGASFGGLLHSDDRGEHWTEVPTPVGPTMLEVQVDPRDPRVLYVAGFEGSQLRLLRSADGGQTWEFRDNGLGFNLLLNLAIDPASPSILYAGTNTGLYRSQDSGQTWTRLPGFGGQVNDVVAAPTRPTTIYAVADGFGVKRSTDGGTTWTTIRSGLAGTNVYELAVDPQNPRRLYAGTTTRGVLGYEEPPGND